MLCPLLISYFISLSGPALSYNRTLKIPATSMHASKLKVNKEVPCFLDAPETLLLAQGGRRMSKTRYAQPNGSMGQTEESEQMTHYSSRLAHQALPVFVWRRMYRNTAHANACSYSTNMNPWWFASVSVYVSERNANRADYHASRCHRWAGPWRDAASEIRATRFEE